MTDEELRDFRKLMAELKAKNSGKLLSGKLIEKNKTKSLKKRKQSYNSTAKQLETDLNST